MTIEQILTLAPLGLGLVWLVRLEGRVNMGHKDRLDLIREIEKNNASIMELSHKLDDMSKVFESIARIETHIKYLKVSQEEIKKTLNEK